MCCKCSQPPRVHRFMGKNPLTCSVRLLEMNLCLGLFPFVQNSEGHKVKASIAWNMEVPPPPPTLVFCNFHSSKTMIRAHVQHFTPWCALVSECPCMGK